MSFGGAPTSGLGPSTFVNPYANFAAAPSSSLPPPNGVSVGADASTAAAAASTPSAAPAPAALPSWMPDLPAFLDRLPELEQTIPDEIVQHLLERAGCNVQDPKLVRLVALASQHFLLDVLTDAKQIQHLRRSMGERKSDDSELTLRDLSTALHGHGIDLNKPDYIADHAHAGGGLLRTDQALAETKAGLVGARRDKAAKKS